MLFTDNQLSILSVLINEPEGELHFRDLARRLQKEPGVIQKSLNNLEVGGFVKSRRRGNQRLISFNIDHPLAEEVKNIVEKSAGVRAALKKIMDELGEIKTALIFGSYARGNYTKASDMDLLIVGNPNCETELTNKIGDIEKKIGREINFKLYSPDEFRRRMKNKDPFLEEILGDKCILLKGKL